MKVVSRPKSKMLRGGLAVLAVWVAAAIAFVLFNRYRYGSDWDSIADLLMLALFVPLGLAFLATAIWLAGRRLSLVVLSLAAAAIAIGVMHSAHQTHERRLAEEQRRIEFKQTDARVAAKCAAAKSEPQAGGFDPYVLCLMLEEDAAAKER